MYNIITNCYKDAHIQRYVRGALCCDYRSMRIDIWLLVYFIRYILYKYIKETDLKNHF